MRPEDACHGIAGADGVHRDAVGSVIQRCCACHAYHTELGGAVQGLPALRYKPCDRSHIDEKATLAAAFQDSLCAVLHAGKNTLAVQGENLLIVGHLILMQRRTAHTDARIADNTVQPAIVGNRLVHQILNGGCLAAIGLDKDGIPTLFTDTVCNGFTLFHTAGGADDFMPWAP